MYVLFACGGTDGHIYPALSVAHLLKSRFPTAEIAFVGTKRGMENTLVPAEGFSFFGLDTEGFLRSASPHNIVVFRKLLAAEKTMHRLFCDHRPDLVIGTGGYACFPVLVQAHKEGIATAVHESNAVPGLAVRLLRHKVDRVWCGSRQAAEKLGRPPRVVHTGTPVRDDFLRWTKATARLKHRIGNDRFFVLSFGGSLGASVINRTIREIFESELPARIHWMPISGRGGAGMFESIRPTEAKRYLAFSSEMPSLMQAADLVICRAGALTLTELAYCGKPAILIPSPNVTGHHQYHNAKERADAGAAILMEETALSAVRLLDEVVKIERDRTLVTEMQQAMRGFYLENAGETILSEIRLLLSV